MNLAVDILAGIGASMFAIAALLVITGFAAALRPSRAARS
jgi:hypothetical protein